METKFTQDGKKVAVLGKLNNNEWIVQQIFVADGEEFPSGENFVTRSLLDKPAETYLATSVKKLEAEKQSIEKEIEQLKKELRAKRTCVSVRSEITRMLEHYAKAGISEIQQLIDFLEGQINFVVWCDYDKCLILPIEEALTRKDEYGRLDRIQLLSVYGLYNCSNIKECKLNFDINRYGEGRQIYFYRTYEEAVAKLDAIVFDKRVDSRLIELKKKYNLVNPTQDQIEAFYKQQKENAIKEVAKLRQQLEEKQKIVDEL